MVYCRHTLTKMSPASPASHLPLIPACITRVVNARVFGWKGNLGGLLRTPPCPPVPHLSCWVVAHVQCTLRIRAEERKGKHKREQRTEGVRKINRKLFSRRILTVQRNDSPKPLKDSNLWQRQEIDVTAWGGRKKNGCVI